VRIDDPRAEALAAYLEAELIEHGPEGAPLVLGSRRESGGN
jgi:hypothetical protein